MRSLFDNKNNVEVRPTHLPLFFLAVGQGMRKLEVVPNGGVGKFYEEFYESRRRRVSLLGFKSSSDHSRITYRLPEGKEIDIKPINPPFHILRDCSEFEFHLGFTLRGPIAYNVKELSSEDHRIKSFNDH